MTCKLAAFLIIKIFNNSLTDRSQWAKITWARSWTVSNLDLSFMRVSSTAKLRIPVNPMAGAPRTCEKKKKALAQNAERRHWTSGSRLWLPPVFGFLRKTNGNLVKITSWWWILSPQTRSYKQNSLYKLTPHWNLTNPIKHDTNCGSSDWSNSSAE